MSIFSSNKKIPDEYKFNEEESNLINQICLNLEKETNIIATLSDVKRGEGNYLKWNVVDFTEYIEFFYETERSKKMPNKFNAKTLLYIGFYKYIIRSPKDPSLCMYGLDRKKDRLFHYLKEDIEKNDFPRVYTAINTNRIVRPHDIGYIAARPGAEDPIGRDSRAFSVTHSKIIRIKNSQILSDGEEYLDADYVDEVSLQEIKKSAKVLLKELLVDEFPDKDIDNDAPLSSFVNR